MQKSLYLNCYCPQRSWGKVMFLHVSVILFTEGVSVSVSVRGRSWSLSRGSLSGGGFCPGGVSVWGSLSGGSLSRGSLSREVFVQGGSLSAGSLSWRHPHTVMSGRYTSYWNAFLFWLVSIKLYLMFGDNTIILWIFWTCLILFTTLRYIFSWN